MKKNVVRLSLVLTMLVLTTLACSLPSFQAQNTPEPVVREITAIPAPVQEVAVPLLDQDALTTLFQNVSPGVVSIQVMTDQGGGLGSGFVYDKDGHIITNYHVIEGAADIEVDFPSGFKAFGEVIGTDLDSDIAVLKVEAPESELFPLRLGDSSSLLVGQYVVAIGSPFGLTNSMTVGIVSALGRTLESMRQTASGQNFSAGDLIQTDAAINPGNSGGPLLNLKGEVIGINRAIRTTNFSMTGEPTNTGIGFAISINIVKRVVPELIETGTYDYPYLGVTSRDSISLREAQVLGLKQATGAYVVDVTPGGPADKAGLRAGTRPTEIQGLNAGGDLIIGVDGLPVRVFGDLLSYLFNNKSPGDQITLTVLRGNETKEITITLGKRP